MKRPIVLVGAICALAAAGSPCGAVLAAPADASPSGVVLDLEALRADVESGDLSRTVHALEGIEAAGDAGRPAVTVLQSLLLRGASVPILVRALNLVGGLGSAVNSGAVAPYARHRVAKVRWAAARALGGTGGSIAERALRHGLRSKGSRLREISAESLGRMGAQGAYDDLASAIQRGVRSAAKAAGSVCSPRECLRLAALLDVMPLSRLNDGLLGALLRPHHQVPSEVKAAVVERVARLSSPAARRLLQAAHDRLAGAAEETLVVEAIARELTRLSREQTDDKSPPERSPVDGEELDGQ